MKTVTECNLGREGFIWLTYLDNSSKLREVKAGTQGRNLEAGTEAETVQELCLLAATQKKKMPMSYASCLARVSLKLWKFIGILNES